MEEERSQWAFMIASRGRAGKVSERTSRRSLLFVAATFCCPAFFDGGSAVGVAVNEGRRAAYNYDGAGPEDEAYYYFRDEDEQKMPTVTTWDSRDIRVTEVRKNDLILPQDGLPSGNQFKIVQATKDLFTKLILSMTKDWSSLLETDKLQLRLAVRSLVNGFCRGWKYTPKALRHVCERLGFFREKSPLLFADFFDVPSGIFDPALKTLNEIDGFDPVAAVDPSAATWLEQQDLLKKQRKLLETRELGLFQTRILWQAGKWCAQALFERGDAQRWEEMSKIIWPMLEAVASWSDLERIDPKKFSDEAYAIFNAEDWMRGLQPGARGRLLDNIMVRRARRRLDKLFPRGTLPHVDTTAVKVPVFAVLAGFLWGGFVRASVNWKLNGNMYDPETTGPDPSAVISDFNELHDTLRERLPQEQFEEVRKDQTAAENLARKAGIPKEDLAKRIVDAVNAGKSFEDFVGSAPRLMMKAPADGGPKNEKKPKNLKEEMDALAFYDQAKGVAEVLEPEVAKAALRNFLALGEEEVKKRVEYVRDVIRENVRTHEERYRGVEFWPDTDEEEADEEKLWIEQSPNQPRPSLIEELRQRKKKQEWNKKRGRARGEDKPGPEKTVEKEEQEEVEPKPADDPDEKKGEEDEEPLKTKKKKVPEKRATAKPKKATAKPKKGADKHKPNKTAEKRERAPELGLKRQQERAESKPKSKPKPKPMLRHNSDPHRGDHHHHPTGHLGVGGMRTRSRGPGRGPPPYRNFQFEFQGTSPFFRTLESQSAIGSSSSGPSRTPTLREMLEQSQLASDIMYGLDPTSETGTSASGRGSGREGRQRAFFQFAAGERPPAGNNPSDGDTGFDPNECPSEADRRAVIQEGDPLSETGAILKGVDTNKGAKSPVFLEFGTRDPWSEEISLERRYVYLKALKIVREMEARAGFSKNGTDLLGEQDGRGSSSDRAVNIDRELALRVRERVSSMSLWLLSGGSAGLTEFLRSVIALQVRRDFGIVLLGLGERERKEQMKKARSDVLTLNDADMEQSLLIEPALDRSDQLRASAARNSVGAMLAVLHFCSGFHAQERVFFWRVVGAGLVRVVAWIRRAIAENQAPFESGGKKKTDGTHSHRATLRVGLKPFVLKPWVPAEVEEDGGGIGGENQNTLQMSREEKIRLYGQHAVGRSVWATDLSALVAAAGGHSTTDLGDLFVYQFANFLTTDENQGMSGSPVAALTGAALKNEELHETLERGFTLHPETRLLEETDRNGATAPLDSAASEAELQDSVSTAGTSGFVSHGAIQRVLLGPVQRASSKNENAHLKTWVIVLSVLGGVLLIAAVVVGVLLFRRVAALAAQADEKGRSRKRKKGRSTSSDDKVKSETAEPVDHGGSDEVHVSRPAARADDAEEIPR